MSCRCSGSTHDALDFDTSELAAKLRSGAIRPGYWATGDAVYVPMPGLLTPWSKYHLAREDGIYAHSFNFYHFSHRMHVEQEFGLLVRRWELLWKPLQFCIRPCPMLTDACMRLHNLCVDQEGVQSINQCSSLLDCETEDEDFREWWSISEASRSMDEHNRVQGVIWISASFESS